MLARLSRHFEHQGLILCVFPVLPPRSRAAMGRHALGSSHSVASSKPPSPSPSPSLASHRPRCRADAPSCKCRDTAPMPLARACPDAIRPASFGPAGQGGLAPAVEAFHMGGIDAHAQLEFFDPPADVLETPEQRMRFHAQQVPRRVTPFFHHARHQARRGLETLVFQTPAAMTFAPPPMHDLPKTCRMAAG